MQREYTGVYPSSGKEGPMSSGEERVLYFLTPKCLRRVYKLREREPVPSLKREYNGALLGMLILVVRWCLVVFVLCPLLSPRRVPFLPFYRVK
jgi:hypothetical protein